MGLLLEKIQSWRYIRPLPNPHKRLPAKTGDGDDGDGSVCGSDVGSNVASSSSVDERIKGGKKFLLSAHYAIAFQIGQRRRRRRNGQKEGLGRRPFKGNSEEEGCLWPI